jgi:4-aminobutyrate aminotransferase
MSEKLNQSPERAEGDINLSPRRQAWAEQHINADTRALLAEDEQYFLHQALSTPCLNVLEGSDGIYLHDSQGREIMDFHGNSVHQVGHGHPRVIEAIKVQLDQLPFCPRRYTNQVAIDLARKLVELAPGDLNKLLFAPGGTLAIGMALKLARYATGRHKTISMCDSFHGASLDAISIGGEALFRKDVGPLLPGSEHTDFTQNGSTQLHTGVQIHCS